MRARVTLVVETNKVVRSLRGLPCISVPMRRMLQLNGIKWKNLIEISLTSDEVLLACEGTR